MGNIRNPPTQIFLWNDNKVLKRKHKDKIFTQYISWEEGGGSTVLNQRRLVL